MTDLSQKVLSKYVIKNASLPNRLAVAPMTRVSATADGLLTQAMHDYYLRFARGGFALIISEGLYTDRAFSQGYLFQPGLVSDVQARSWAAANQALQQQGATVFAQLMHAGALSQGNRFCELSAGPSAVQPMGEQMPFYFGAGRYHEPVELSEAQIAEVIQGFVDSAARAVHIGGFDGIEIHGAHGYLLDQFLTTYTNQRTDRWGGGIHARVALLVDIVKAIKAELGSAVPVGIRISQSKVNDFDYKWPGGEVDAQVIFSSLAQAGADFIHVSEYRAWQPAFAEGQATLVALARRYAPGLTIIANGSLLDIGRANDALHDGADLIAQGEGALSNPDLPQLYAAGREPRPFDGSILGPIANIKDSELAFSGGAFLSPLKYRMALAGLLIAIAGASQAGPRFEAGSLPAKWFSAGLECATFQDDFQVHAYNDNLYILRQSGCVSSDKPFLYLLFGKERAILFDTGAGDDTAPASGRVPNVVGAVDQVINQWLARNKRQSIPLVVTHLHGHADHVVGDAQFAKRPGTTFLKPDDVEVLKGFFGITRWPQQSVAYDLGGRILDIIPVPGHDATSIAVYDRQTAVLLTGDVVYPGRIYVNDPDPQVMQDSLQRLVDFTDSRPVAHVLGSHIEQRAPYVENPIGLHYAPQEVPLQLGRAHLLEILEATRLRSGGRVVQKAYRDFTLCGKYPSCTPVNVGVGK